MFLYLIPIELPGHRLAKPREKLDHAMMLTSPPNDKKMDNVEM